MHQPEPVESLSFVDGILLACRDGRASGCSVRRCRVVAEMGLNLSPSFFTAMVRRKDILCVCAFSRSLTGLMGMAGMEEERWVF